MAALIAEGGPVQQALVGGMASGPRCMPRFPHESECCLLFQPDAGEIRERTALVKTFFHQSLVNAMGDGNGDPLRLAATNAK